MIEDRTGNIFLTDCDVITVTVNCEGVMGAGIALDARLRWPAMFERYRTICEEGKLRPGRLWLWEDRKLEPQHRVLCFPTKDRWRAPSRIAYVASGLEKLASTYAERGITSIAMPHLGCSEGGLKWRDVRPMIVDSLSGCEELDVELWEYDPSAGDPHFDTLLGLVESWSQDELASALGLRKAQATALIDAVRSPTVAGLSALQTAPGIGESTLERVYDYLFREGDEKQAQEGQQELFWE